LKSGRIKISANSKLFSSEQIIGFLSDDETLLPYRGYPDVHVPFNIEVINDATLYTIDAKNWDILAKKEPIIKDILHQDLSRIIERLLSNIAIVSVPYALQRIRKAIKIYPFLLELSDDDIASFIRLDPKTVNRVLRKSRLRE